MLETDWTPAMVYALTEKSRTSCRLCPHKEGLQLRLMSFRHLDTNLASWFHFATHIHAPLSPPVPQNILETASYLQRLVTQ